MTPLQIPEYWTPEQALAVYELIEDIGEAIWNRYELALIELMQQDCISTFEVDDDVTF
jgi:hypothetical protein